LVDPLALSRRHAASLAGGQVDHLDGLLFLDRVAGAHAVHARRVYL